MDITRRSLSPTENYGSDTEYPPATAVCSPGDVRPLSLALVFARAQADPEYALSAMRDLKSALGAIERHQKSCLSGIPADQKTIERIISDLRASPGGLTSSRIANVASLVRRAAARYCPSAQSQLERGARAELSPTWTALLELLPNHYDSFGMKRFAGWSTNLGLSPQEVQPGHFERFRNTGLEGLKTFYVAAQRLAKTWNRAAQDVPGWPQSRFPIPRQPSRRYRASADELSPSLIAEFEAYLAHRVDRSRPAKVDLRDECSVPGLRKSSAKKSMQLFVRFLGAFRDVGNDLARITSINGLMDLDILLPTVEYLVHRAGGPSSQIGSMVGVLAGLARHHIKDDTLASAISSWIPRVRLEYTGMTQQNRERLVPLQDPAVRRRLLDLPTKLMSEARTGNRKSSTLKAQQAVLLELLLTTALRIGNIAGLHLDRHLQSHGTGDRARYMLTLRPDEVKNGEDRTIKLPPRTTRLLNMYLHEFRDRLPGAESRFLFPAKNGYSKAPGIIGQQISKIIKQRVGIVMNPHLFRGFTVMLYLQSNPGDMAGAMRLLGDRNLQTVMKHYAFIDTAEVFADFHQFVTNGHRHSRTELRARARNRRGQP